MTSRRSSSPSTSGRSTPRANAVEGTWPADAWKGPVLVARLSSLGDVTLATVAVRLLTARRPDLDVDFLTRRAFAPVVHALPGIRRVLLEVEDSPPAQDAYALVLDLQGGAKGKHACHRYAPGAERRTYRRAVLRRRMMVLLGRRVRGPEPVALRFARVVAGDHVRAGELSPGVSVDAFARDALSRALRAGGTPDRGWVVLSPGASRPLKAIPEKLAAAIEAELRRHGWGVVRLLAPGSGPAKGLLESGSGRLQRTFSGDLPEVIALLSAVDAVVSSDSGIQHLATAVERPLVALFGPTVPELGFSPLGRSVVHGVDLPCRPCHVHGPRLCWQGHRRCWRDMEPARIVAALGDLMAGRA